LKANFSEDGDDSYKKWAKNILWIENGNDQGKKGQHELTIYIKKKMFFPYLKVHCCE